jgi:tRNA (cytidine/uridine-2'-O-)-methyltransferase
MSATPSSMPRAPLLHFVLLNPEIPNNTGNIGRTAAALGCRLHVVHPIGFSMDDKARRRAGLDYWHLVDCVEHKDWDAFLEREAPKRLWLFTAHGERSLYDAQFARGDYLLFGKESTGVGAAFEAWAARTFGTESLLRIPQPGTDALRTPVSATPPDAAAATPGRPAPPAEPALAADSGLTASVRSLNLATAVAIAGYEAFRQLNTP